jgi:hypothetical protein
MDRSIGEEHFVAMDVLPLLHRLGASRGRRQKRRLNLSKLRHVGVAENEADVRMCDEAPVGIDDIGLSVFADLDLRHVSTTPLLAPRAAVPVGAL